MSAASAQLVAFQNVRVFTDGEVVDNATVLVEDGQITGVEPGGNVPGGAEVIAGEGLTLLPGLIDSHVHTFYPEALKQELIFGVTTVLDMFSATDLGADLRAQQEAAVTDRADFFSAGTLATAPHGHGTQFGLEIPTLTEPSQAGAWVEERIAEGSDYIKVILESGEELGQETPTLNAETVNAIVNAAHERGLLVVAHVQTLEMAEVALEAGVDGLAHVFTDRVAPPEFIERAAEAGLFVIPTLTVFQRIGADEGIEESVSADERLAPYLSAQDVQNLMAPYSGFEALSVEVGLKNVGLLANAGVPILAGTDAMNPGTAYGASLHEELLLLTMAGLTPAQALIAATAAPARAFALGERGVIREGAKADLLLVEGDPTEEITATRNIVAVYKDGARVNREAYREMLAAERERAATEAQALGSAESVVIGDFEGGDLSAPFGQPWTPTTDADAGGDSTASVAVTPGGYKGSDFALEVSGTVGSAFPFPWSGVMFMPGSAPFAPADLSGIPQLTFAAAGTPGEYRVQLFCQNAPQQPSEWGFTVSQEWSEESVDLTEVGGCDTTGVMAIIFSSGELGQYALKLDDVRLSRP